MNEPKNTISDDQPAIPCGLVAKSFFNDTYELWKKGENGGKDVKIDILKDNIAWSSDIQYKFDNIKTNLPDGKKW